jgi:hypothetical protein
MPVAHSAMGIYEARWARLMVSRTTTRFERNQTPRRLGITNPIFFILILLQSSYGLDEINVYSRVSRQFIAICASLDPFGRAAHITYVGLGSLDVRAVVGNELP